MGTTQVQCSRCKEMREQTREYFYPRRNTKSGWQAWCIACCKEHRNDYYRRQQAAKGLSVKTYYPRYEYE